MANDMGPQEATLEPVRTPGSRGAGPRGRERGVARRPRPSGRTFALVALVGIAPALFACESPAPGSDAAVSDSGMPGSGEEVAALEPAADFPVIPETFLTPMDTLDNVDSPAAWRGPDGEVVLMATAKGSHVIMAYDGETGELIGRWGEEGTGPGQFQRPNGILVQDDLLVVVERDNRRVQLLRLPGFESLGTFGDDVLLKPYGVTGVLEEGVLHLWVTDDFDVTGEGEAHWENRVKRFAVRLEEGGPVPEFVGTLGDAEGPGRLRVVESILADPVHDRLLIADEHEAERVVKVYDLEGRYAGRQVGQGVFAAEPEGIALYACGTGGYYLMADQSPQGNRFQVFDRASLGHLGTFAGEAVANTDGVAVLQGPVGSLGSGAFYAVHDDQGVVGLRWADIAEALELQTDCQID